MPADFTHFCVFVQCWTLALAFKLAGATSTSRTSDLHWWKPKWLYLLNFTCNRLCLFAFRFTFSTQKRDKISPLKWKTLLPWKLNALGLHMAPGWNERMERQRSQYKRQLFYPGARFFAVLFGLVCDRLWFSVHEGKRGQGDNRMRGASVISTQGQPLRCDSGSDAPLSALSRLAWVSLVFFMGYFLFLIYSILVFYTTQPQNCLSMRGSQKIQHYGRLNPTSVQIASKKDWFRAWLFQVKRRLQGHLIATFQYLKGPTGKKEQTF